MPITRLVSADDVTRYEMVAACTRTGPRAARPIMGWLCRPLGHAVCVSGYTVDEVERELVRTLGNYPDVFGAVVTFQDRDKRIHVSSILPG